MLCDLKHRPLDAVGNLGRLEDPHRSHLRERVQFSVNWRT
jgi:hypothetical protein